MLSIRKITESDTTWIQQVFQSINLPWQEGLLGFIVTNEGRNVGLITFVIPDYDPGSSLMDSRFSSSGGLSRENDTKICNIISINSLTPGKGIGNMLLQEVLNSAKEKGCTTATAPTDEITKPFFLKNGFLEKENALEKGL